MAALADPSRHEEREVGPQNGGQQKEWLQGHFCALEASVLDALGWVTTPPTALHFYDRLRALRDSGQARRRGDGAPPRPPRRGPARWICCSRPPCALKWPCSSGPRPSPWRSLLA